MKCSEWQEIILTDYLDDQMGKEQAVQLEEHLLACHECLEFVSIARKAVIEPFEHAQKAEPSERIWHNIKKAIGEEQESEDFASWWDRIKGFIFIPKPAMAFATVVVVLLAATFTFERYNQQFQISKRAVIQSQIEDITYVVEELASFSEENNSYVLTGMEEYFL
jgi:hypothetical protein